jgi:pimeloyl-ACP methyl ester carboxylesterase
VITRVPDVAAFVAQKLTGWGIPRTQINLVGHSYGGYMADQVAKRISGGVDRIVALDPATLALAGVDFSGTDYAAHSHFSLALVGSDYATASAAATADETINVNVGDRSSLATHGVVRDLFAGITGQNNGASDAISALFSLRALETGNQPFLRDAMGNGDEADLTGQVVHGQWLPQTITYVDKATRGTVTVKA